MGSTSSANNRNRPEQRAVVMGTEFAALLRKHLGNGTRPQTSDGEPWTYAEFAGGIPSARNSKSEPVSERTVSNWCKGKAFPSKIEPILQALFGPNSSNRHADARNELRNAFIVGRQDVRHKKDPTSGEHAVVRDLPVEQRPLGGAIGEIVGQVDRPPSMADAPYGYGTYVIGTSMEPRYYPGELIYVHPGKPVNVGCFVLVQLTPKKEGDPPPALIKRLIRRTDRMVVLEQFNPPKTFEIAAEHIRSIHKIVGSDEVSGKSMRGRA